MYRIARKAPLARGFALLLTCSAVGCGGNVKENASAGDVTGSARSADASVPACDHYFAAQYARCGGPVLPASETTRIRARFEQQCQNQVTLPGSGMNAASLEACASALDAAPCESPDGPPVACNFKGSLPGGAPCNEGFQCQSGSCDGTAFSSPDGQIGPITCGTCAPFAAVAVGQVCGHADFSASCAGDALCLITPGEENAAAPTYVCVALVQGDVGAPCDELSASCKTGLYCSAQTGRCAKLGSAGAPCGVGARSPGACTLLDSTVCR